MKKITLLTLIALLFSGIEATVTKKECFLYRDERFIEKIKIFFADIALTQAFMVINVFCEDINHSSDINSYYGIVGKSFPELADKLLDSRSACNPIEECILNKEQATELLNNYKEAMEFQKSINKKTLDQYEREMHAYLAYMIVQSKLDKNENIFEDDQNYNNALKYVKEKDEALKQLTNAACGAAINSLKKYLADNGDNKDYFYHEDNIFYNYYNEEHLNILLRHMLQYRKAIYNLTGFERSLNFNFKNILCTFNTLNNFRLNYTGYYATLLKYFEYNQTPASELKIIEEASILSFKNISRIFNALGMPSYKKQ